MNAKTLPAINPN